jgi:hypothetical protein
LLGHFTLTFFILKTIDARKYKAGNVYRTQYVFFHEILKATASVLNSFIVDRHHIANLEMLVLFWCVTSFWMVVRYNLKDTLNTEAGIAADALVFIYQTTYDTSSGRLKS